jgi:phage-related protein
VAAGDRTAVFRAIGDFSRLTREAKKARKEMGGLGDETKKTGDDIDETSKKSDRASGRLGRLASAAGRVREGMLRAKQTGFGKWLEDTDTRTRKLLKSLAGIAAKAAVLSLLGTAAVASVGPVLSLVGAVAALAGAVGAVPGLMLAGAAAGGVLKVAFLGVGDALKNLGAPTEEFAKSIENLPKPLRDTLWQVRALKPALDSMKKSIQGKFWAGLAKPIRELGETWIPILEIQGGRLASTFNKGAKEAAKFATQPKVVKDWGVALDNVNGFWAKMMKAVRPLLQVITDIAVVSSEFLPDFGEGIAGAAERFAAFIREARESGKLKAWIQGGLDQLRALGQVLYNIGRIFGAVFSAAKQEGNSFFQTLAKITDKFADFLESAEGQNTLRDIFKAASDAADVVIPIIEALFKLLGKLLPVMVKIGQQVGPGVSAVIRGIGHAVDRAEPSLVRLATAIGNFLKSLGNAGPLIGSLVGGLADVLTPVVEALAWLIRTLTDAFNSLPPGMQSVVGGLGGLVLAVGIAIIIFNKLLSVAAKVVGAVGRVAGVLNKVPGVNLPTPGAGGADVGGGGKGKAPKAKAPAAAPGGQLSLFPDLDGKAGKEGDKAGKSFLSRMGAAIKKGGSSIASAIGAVFSGGKTAAAKATSGIATALSWAKSGTAAVIRGIGTAIGALAVAFRALGAALLANPIVIIIAAIAAAAYLIITNWDTVKGWLAAFWNWLKSIFAAGLKFVTDIWNAAWTGISAVATTVWEAIKSAISAAINFVASVISAVLDGIRAVWDAVWGAIKTAAEWVWNGIKSVVETVINAVKTVIETTLGIIRSIWDAGWKAVSDIVTGIWDIIKSVVGGAVGFVSDLVGGLVDGILWLWEQAKKALGWIVDKTGEAINAAKELLGIQTTLQPKEGSYQGPKKKVTFSKGGRIPGHGNRDDRELLAKPGEYVSPVETTKKWLPLLRALNPHDRGQLEVGSLISGMTVQPTMPEMSVNVTKVAGSVAGDRGIRDVHVTQIVHNPLPEKPSETASKHTGRAARLGVTSVLGGSA